MEFNATFLISAISFIVFVIIMNFIFYKPIEKIVNERQAFVDENFDEAKKNNLNSQKIIAEHDEKIDEANSEGKMIIVQKSDEAKKQKSAMILNAKEKSSNDILNNQKELEKAFEITKKNLDFDFLSNEMLTKLSSGGENAR